MLWLVVVWRVVVCVAVIVPTRVFGTRRTHDTRIGVSVKYATCKGIAVLTFTTLIRVLRIAVSTDGSQSHDQTRFEALSGIRAEARQASPMPDGSLARSVRLRQLHQSARGGVLGPFRAQCAETAIGDQQDHLSTSAINLLASAVFEP